MQPPIGDGSEAPPGFRLPAGQSRQDDRSIRVSQENPPGCTVDKKIDQVLATHPDWVDEVWFDRLPPRRVATPDDLEDHLELR